jgi:hypothetical protein
MFDFRPSEYDLGMASTPQPNTTEQDPKLHSRPEDPGENTRPLGNGDREHPDVDRAAEKLQEVSGH